MSESTTTTRRAKLDFDPEPQSVDETVTETQPLSDVEVLLQDALSYEDFGTELDNTPVVVSQEAQTTQASETIQEQDETTQPQYNDEELKKFQEMFKNVFGLDPETVKAQLETQQKESSQKKLEQDLNTLQTEWGVDRTELSKRLDLVSQRLSSISPELQKSLDNPEGIRLLWDSISSDTSRKVPPRFEKNSVPPVRAKPQLTWAQIEAMDNATYERNSAAILAAIQKGLVK